MSRKKALIDTIEVAKAVCNKVSSELAKLAKDIIDGYEEGPRILMELLQNADDADASQVSLSLTASGGSRDDFYFVIRHNGKAFSEHDVKRVCRYDLSVEETKILEDGRTGFKGLGFLSVFTRSTWVAVFSGGYQFCFDKAYWDSQATGEEEYAWMSIPRWLDASPVTMSGENVTIVLKIDSANLEFFQKEFATLETNIHRLQFTKKIRKVVIADGVLRAAARTFVFANNQITRDVRGRVNPLSRWMPHKKNIDIPSGVKAALGSMSASSCPQRLKDPAKIRTTLSFSAKRDSAGGLVALNDGVPCITFPTEINSQLPFYIDAEFIPNNVRTDFTKSRWNEFLIESIVFEHFNWLASLATQEDLQGSYLSLLLPPEVPPALSRFEEAYERGYERGLNEVAFIRVCNSTTLIKVRECAIDPTDFFAQFGQQYADRADKVVNPKLGDLSRLYALGVVNIQDTVLIEAIQSFVNEDNDPHNHGRLIEFLSTLELDIDSLCLIWCTDGYLRALNDVLYFNNEADIEGIELLSVHFVRTELFASPENEAWLSRMGVLPFSEQIAIEENIDYMIQAGQITVDNVIDITRYAFTAYVNRKLPKSGACWEVLKHLKVLLSSNSPVLLEPHAAYLSDKFEPQDKLQGAGVRKNIFVSEHYIAQGESRTSWREFFSKMGVRHQIVLEHYPEISREKFLRTNGMATAYLRSSVTGIIKPDPRHTLLNYINVGMADILLEDEAYQPFFWRALLKEFDTLLESPDYLYVDGRPRASVKVSRHFISFLLESTQFFKDANGDVHSITEFCHPDLGAAVGDLLPVLQLPDNLVLTSEQAEYLGLKTTLSVQDCLKILLEIEDVDQPSANQYLLIARQLLANVTLEDEESILEWAENGGYFIANDNSIQPVNEMEMYLIAGSHPPANSNKYFKDFPELTYEQKVQLANLFGMGVQDASIVEVNDSDRLPSPLNPYMRALFPALVVIEAHALNVNEEALYDELHTKFDELKFIQVSRLVLANTTESVNAFIDLRNKHFYYRVYTGSQLRGVNHSGSIRAAFARELCNYLGITAPYALDFLADLVLVEDEELPLDWAETVLPLTVKTLFDEAGYDYDDYQDLLAYQDGDHDLKSEAETSASITTRLADDQIADEDDDDDDNSEKDANASNNNKRKKEQSSEKKKTEKKKADVESTTTSTTSTTTSTTTSSSSEPGLSEYGNVSGDHYQKSQIVLKRRVSAGLGGRSKTKSGDFTDKANLDEEQEKQEQRKSTGKWAEVTLFLSLIKRYREKTQQPNHRYFGCVCEEEPKGFALKGNGRVLFRCIWNNKSGMGQAVTYKESGMHYDFKFERYRLAATDDAPKERIIEVKGTTSNRAAPAVFTYGEINEARTAEYYHVYRVYGVNNPHGWFYQKSKDFSEKVKSIDMELMELKIRL